MLRFGIRADFGCGDRAAGNLSGPNYDKRTAGSEIARPNAKPWFLLCWPELLPLSPPMLASSGGVAALDVEATTINEAMKASAEELRCDRVDAPCVIESFKELARKGRSERSVQRAPAARHYDWSILLVTAKPVHILEPTTSVRRVAT